MPIVRHRTGPLAGQEQTIDSRVERIVFGRDPSGCDVIFPPDLTLVARRHFALVRKPSGDWAVEDFGEPFVAVDGHPADETQAVASGAMFELGQVGGPSFEFVTGADDANPSLPPTAIQQRVENAYSATRGVRRVALIGLAAAVLVGGVTMVTLFLNRNQATKLDHAVAELTKVRSTVASEAISAPVRDKVMAAAHVVVIRYANGIEKAQGTASPIAPDLLATNAHVAEIFLERKPGDRLFVRSPGANGRLVEVTEVKLHPGWKGFQDYLTSDPFYTQAVPHPLLGLKTAPSYDVATLRVASDAKLGPVLEIASREEMVAMRPGMPLALAGYPLEGIIGSEVQPMGATPNLRTGMVNALTDFFLLPTSSDQQRLVHHDVPVTGGNSGSPMVDANGKLVALLNSGNIQVREKQRMPSAAIVNYAQRADVLLDLVEGRAEAALASDRAYWDQQTSRFKRGFDLIVPVVIEKSKPVGAGQPTLVQQVKGSLAKSEAYTGNENGREVKRRQAIHPVTLRAGTPTLLMAYAERRSLTQLYLVVDGKVVAENAQNTWFPAIPFTPASDVKADVYVVGPDEDVDYSLLHYTWPSPRS